MNNFSLLKKALFCLNLLICFVLHSQPSMNAVSQPIPGSYVPGEIIILFESGLSDTEKQDLRDDYQVTSYEIINNRLELWEVSFPLPVDDNGSTVILLNEYELLDYIHNNGDTRPGNNGSTGGGTEGGGIANPGRGGGINGGEFNYALTGSPIIDNPTPLPNDPLTVCPGNSHLYGNTGPHTNNLPTIVIMDQVMTLRTPDVQHFFTPQYTLPEGRASHADQVDYIANFVNTANGLSPQVINLVIFDELGQATYVDFLKAINWLYENSYQHLVINMSGSAMVNQIGENSQIVLSRVNDMLTDMGSVMVTSAGNDAMDTNEGTVLPGGALMNNEITVAGTSNCYTQAWAGSNLDNVQFEIAAEAENLLVPFNTTSWVEADGTSYSAPQVTAALVQIASHVPFATTLQLKQQLLTTADHIAALDDHSRWGQVLNATAATTFGNGMGLAAVPETEPQAWEGLNPSFNETDIPEELVLEVSPNPTNGAFTLRWNSPGAGPAILEIYNDLGQRLSQRTLPSGEHDIQLSMQTLGAKQAGLYLLRVRQADQVTTRRIILR
ncbi:MAG: S8 family serine peptidase [Bacteroidota bacterium]